MKRILSKPGLLKTWLLLARLGARIGALAGDFTREFRRLNSGLIGEERLSQFKAHERVHAVKAALDRRHRGPTRCC